MDQLTLQLLPGVGVRYRSLLESIAAGMYQRGLNRVSAMIDCSPSHLSEKLGGGERNRHLSVEDMERYIAESGDTTPILYLAAKYCRDPAVQQREALALLQELLPQVASAVEAAGLKPSKSRR